MLSDAQMPSCWAFCDAALVSILLREPQPPDPSMCSLTLVVNVGFTTTFLTTSGSRSLTPPSKIFLPISWPRIPYSTAQPENAIAATTLSVGVASAFTCAGTPSAKARAMAASSSCVVGGTCILGGAEARDRPAA